MTRSNCDAESSFKWLWMFTVSELFVLIINKKAFGIKSSFIF